MSIALNKSLGNIDLYLLDFILKGYFPEGIKILDAGCGEGRNLHFFLQNNYEVYGFDRNPDAIRMVRLVARSLDKSITDENFLVSDIKDHPFPPAAFDLVVCSAVLHFANDKEHFIDMMAELIKTVKKGGKLFIRMASDIGIEKLVEPVDDGKFLMPDGSLRFLLNRNLYNEVLEKYGMQEMEPLKTVNVADLRCMSTFLWTKTE